MTLEKAIRKGVKNRREQGFSSRREVYGMALGLVKWDDRSRNSGGEDGILDLEGQGKA